jgi:hypothetical protein
MLFAVLFGLMLCQPTARAEDFCALTVDVMDRNLEPVTGTWVELLDSRGNVELRTRTESPTLRICDFGFGPHTLRVGTNNCLPVEVSNLQLVLGSPLHLKVITNPCAYRDEVRSTCLLYIRAVDGANTPVAGAEISPVGRSADPPPKTDSYGRFQTLSRGDKEIVLTKEGYEPGRARVQCKDSEQLDVKIVMEKSK